MRRTLLLLSIVFFRKTIIMIIVPSIGVASNELVKMNVHHAVQEYSSFIVFQRMRLYASDMAQSEL